MSEKLGGFNSVLKSIGAEIKSTMLSKRAGFFIALAAAVLSVAEAIVYASCYTNTDYYSVWGVLLPILGAVLFLLLSLFRVTTPYAPAVLFAFDLAAFAAYVNAVYMYLTEVFYGGLTAEAFAALSPAFVACTIMYLASFIIANVSVYIKQNAAANTTERGEVL